MFTASEIKAIFSEGVELDAQTAQRRIKAVLSRQLDIDTIKKALAQFVEESVLNSRISLKDPNDYTELKSFANYEQLETYKRSKNRLKNSITAETYSIDEAIEQIYYRLVNPEYIYAGLERVVKENQINALIYGCDTISFSKETTPVQLRNFKNLTRVISDALNRASINPNDIIGIPTGDGYFIVYKQIDFKQFLTFATNVQEIILNDGLDLPLRVGLHTGSLYEVHNSRNGINAIGHGLNSCARIMSAGDRNHILASGDLFNTCISHSEHEKSFAHIGHIADKHTYKYEVYNFCSGKYGNQDLPKQVIPK